MPAGFKEDFPTTFATLDCTELKVERPASLLPQSQSYSDYKSTQRIGYMLSSWFSHVCVHAFHSIHIRQRDFQTKQHHYSTLQSHSSFNLQPGDSIMAEKGFLSEKDVEDVGLVLNIPPFAKSNAQMPAPDVQKTKSIAKQRVHVERSIAKI